MTRATPSLSTDQVLAFVELARTGSIRLAAEALSLSEEGLRSRLLTLEERVGCELYHKARGRRDATTLTHDGRMLLEKARRFIDQANELLLSHEPGSAPREILVLSSQYLAYYLLIDVVGSFQQRFPHIAVRLVTRTEEQIREQMLASTAPALGICAPSEFPAALEYRHWFAMGWHFIAPQGHPLLRRADLQLEDLVDEPLIVFEPGSTGRQHVLEAFYRRELSPTVAMEATTTQLVVRMVEAGLGVAIVPLLHSGAVTRGTTVGSVALGDQIRPIESGVFLRADIELDEATHALLDYVLASTP
jgi:DNA-binding transcriptional LysR family regulator